MLCNILHELIFTVYVTSSATFAGMKSRSWRDKCRKLKLIWKKR